MVVPDAGRLVDCRFGNRLSDSFDFVLQVKLSTLQFDQSEIVARGVEQFLLDFLLESLVPSFEFGKVGLQGHWRNLQVALRVMRLTQPLAGVNPKQRSR
jgi:hypothetical protein